MNKNITRKTRKHNPLENLIGYLLSVALSFGFALYCSWRIGIFLVLSFVLAPVLSLLLTLLFRRLLIFSSEPSKSFVAKKETFHLNVTVRNRFLFPTPGILVYVASDPHVTYTSASYELAVMPLSAADFQITATAAICGGGQMGIEKIQLQDYLGLFVVSLPVRSLHEIAIVPDIPEISPDEDFIRQTYVMSSTSGESDETVEASTNIMGAFPGYEHREYTPGDPIKRINWKLSAKRDKLYVRLDDELATSSVRMILDPRMHITDEDLDRLPPNIYPESNKAILPALIAQNAMESALGIAMTLLSRNLKVIFYYYHDKTWQTMQLINTAQVTLLQQELASYTFAQESAERFPFTVLPKDGAVFICTASRYTEIPFTEIMVYSSLDGKGRQL